jgi:3-oxoacyl-(acyl-carrier-protein) synthase III
MMIPVRILGTASAFPGRLISTAEIAAAAIPPIDPDALEAKTGIRTRYHAGPGMLLSEIAVTAVRGAVENAGIDVRDLRRVILVSSSGGDIIGPATASAVVHALGLDNRADGFDVVNACTGFLTALDVGARSVATGLFPVAVVAAELLSRGLRPDLVRPYVVFGDGAGAAVLGPGRPGEGIVGHSFVNDGSLGGTVFVEHPSLTRKMEYVQFNVSNREMGSIVLEGMRRIVEDLRERYGLSMADMDWVVPHQPNGVMLAAIVDELAIDPAKVVATVAEVGSIVAASIPVCLDRLLRTRPVRPGDRILMLGVGSGVAYGGVIYRVAP